MHCHGTSEVEHCIALKQACNVQEALQAAEEACSTVAAAPRPHPAALRGNYAFLAAGFYEGRSMYVQ